jgi:hypothetical protein
MFCTDVMFKEKEYFQLADEFAIVESEGWKTDITFIFFVVWPW